MEMSRPHADEEAEEKGLRDSTSGPAEVRFEISPEQFKLYAYLTLFSIFGTGFLLTSLFATLPKETVIKKIFGYDNLCIVFDFEPATWVMPMMYLVFTAFWLIYNFSWQLRVHLRNDEGLISSRAKTVMLLFTLFESFAMSYFIMVFVNNPQTPGNPVYRLMLHMHPFTIFIVAVFTNSLKNVWYLSALKKLPGLRFWALWSFVALLFVVTVFKVLTQINAMVREGGLLWRPDADPISGIVDKLWTVMVTVVCALYTYFVELKILSAVQFTAVVE